MVRTSINIGNSRILDNDITNLEIIQYHGEHHYFEINLRQDVNNKGVLSSKSEDWIGKIVKIGIDDTSDDGLISSTIEGKFVGVVTAVNLFRKGGETILSVKGNSPTIYLDDGPINRSFTTMDLNEIVHSIFNSGYSETANVDPQFRDSLPYTVQYNESNFDFIVRLANRFGEWCFYDGLEFFFGRPKDEEPIILDFGMSGLMEFNIELKAIPSSFEIKGYDYKTNEVLEKPSATYQFPTSELAVKVWDIAEKEIYNNAPAVSLQTTTHEEEIDQIAYRRVQIAMDEIEVISGKTRNPKLKIGSIIEVHDKLIGENYGSYKIISIRHEISQGGDYINDFQAVPSDLISPPLSNMSQAPFCETQVATICDIQDEDSLGRVKVKFLWQEGSETSPWLRVASPYTGKDKGFYLIPEEGDQVLVAFEANNPDKPYVLTGMYHGEHKPEWYDHKNYFFGFKSKAGNQWKFDDKRKTILIEAPSEININAGTKITINAGGDDGPKITLDKSTDTLTLQAKHIKIIGNETTKITGSNTLDLITEKLFQGGKDGQEAKEVTIQGTTVTIKGGTSVDVDGGGGKINVSSSKVNLNPS